MWREHEQWIKDAVSYIERNIKENVDAVAVAEHCSVSRFHFNRVFQRHVGVSAATLLRERRLAEAAVDLLSTDKRILDIALEYRFSGQDSFTRAFKQMYGMTPNEYRKGFRCFHWTKEENRMIENQDSIPELQAAPPGWTITGVYPNQYRVSVDRVHVHRGRASGTIRAKEVADPRGFCTLMQMIKAGKYAGQRLRLSGFLKTDGVKGWAGMWMRVDAKDEVPINFDNMDERPIVGTTEWSPYEVVLDIAPYAEVIAFGVLLSGSGQVWMDGIRLDMVDDSVPTTGGLAADNKMPDEPVNLDFEMDCES
ncbi:helix-turn-helix transcriptional regulator [Paenibacillus alvei]|uniref:Helix-turn-helix transcriptional regulator n=1 Tax=Paenibacillus alvei TaxID=44250 RepID=A0AAP7A141_PAEAL|nr:AraC family transcriptional regulator [Paenibacillus alvei]NOJ72554.1 helix-turn-helix transcriptional regulator [Paenibacillus alvei]